MVSFVVANGVINWHSALPCSDMSDYVFFILIIIMSYAVISAETTVHLGVNAIFVNWLYLVDATVFGDF